MTKATYRAIFFDADDTLINHARCERVALETVFAGLGLRFRAQYQPIFHKIDRALWDSVAHGKNTMPEDEIATHRFKEFFDAIGQSGDCARANTLYRTGLASACELLPNALKVVRELHGRGIKICIVTNGVTALQRPRVANSKIGKYITQIIVSEEVGARKPSPKIFAVLLERLGMTAGDVLGMVGDQIDKDVAGAQRAGIRGIWFNPNGAPNTTDIRPDLEIKSLLEVLRDDL